MRTVARFGQCDIILYVGAKPCITTAAYMLPLFTFCDWIDRIVMITKIIHFIFTYGTPCCLISSYSQWFLRLCCNIFYMAWISKRKQAIAMLLLCPNLCWTAYKIQLLV